MQQLSELKSINKCIIGRRIKLGNLCSRERYCHFSWHNGFLPSMHGSIVAFLSVA